MEYGTTAVRRYGDTDHRQGVGPVASPETHISTIAHELFADEVEAARRTGNLGYMARVLAQVTLPHSKPATNEYTRCNGNMTLAMWAPSDIGLPYGGLPRVLVAWLTTEAVRTKERTLTLGPTLTGFMEQIGLAPTGGRWGTIPRLHEQIRRLFAAQIICTYDDANVSRGTALNVASEYELWWSPKQPHQATLWQSTVTLGERFFKDIIEHPVPVDVSVLKALKRSPLALDLYIWMTYRYSYLDKPVRVPWDALYGQFGADYERMRKYREKMLQALAKVHGVYPEARFEVDTAGLRLLPSPTHIPMLTAR